MQTTIEVIRELYAYDRWANGRTLGAVARLTTEEYVRDLGGSFRSVRDTMTHILSAEWMWLRRWKGTSPRALLDPATFPTPDALRERWREVEAELDAFLDGLTQGELDRIVEYTTTRGEAKANPLGMLLHHVVNHSTYHRGQVVYQLRLLGRPAEATDFFIFAGERARV